MSDQPVRWVDDPGFEADLNCRLRDVRALHQGYDLDAIRARAFGSATEPPAVPRVTRLPRWLVGLGGGVAVLIAGLLGSALYDAPPEGPAPSPALAAPPAPAPATVAPPAVAAPPVDAPAARPPTPSRVAPAPGQPPPSDPGPVPIAAAAPASPPVVVLPPGLAGTILAAENRAYDDAFVLLSRGAAAEALEAFDRQLETFPEGRLADDADLGRLEAFAQLERWSDVERLAAELSARPSLAVKRESVLRQRADALVRLGRCGEAIETAAEVSRQQAAAIRRSCAGR